ncbi:MAG: SemiSWEET transporter [Elusimicrobiota bacterium]|jgi:MtN3 and saliva related transmembrane protein|nr:SemiSWEET transporter [Elusimicrobiota bacterium]
MEILGFIAGFCTAVSFIPQVYKTWKSKSAKDVSIQMFLIYSLASILWIIYGVGAGSMPVIATNVVLLALSIMQAIMKAMYDKRAKQK